MSEKSIAKKLSVKTGNKILFLNSPKIKPTVTLWVTYPKGTSKMKADINRDTIAAYASSIGFKPVAMFAVDETWAALRLKMI